MPLPGDLKSQHILLSTLLKIYQSFYPHKEAIQKFLSHFNIESYFDPRAPLTQKEIQVLIAMREDSRCKVIANKFGCSVPTAGNHIHNINGKLTSGILHEVLRKLPQYLKINKTCIHTFKKGITYFTNQNLLYNTNYSKWRLP